VLQKDKRPITGKKKRSRWGEKKRVGLEKKAGAGEL